jgi:predicted dehydrogenase
MSAVVLVGTGYVADLYMRSLKTFPQIAVKAAFDRNANRLAQFCAYWGITKANSLDTLIESADERDVVLNLTNPAEHFKVSLACLQAGRNVYSEKPLATQMTDAVALHECAAQKKVLLASAPCSVLSEAAQTLWRAVRDGIAGKALLVYAELDDDFVSQAPYRMWKSESGAPWPYADEFRVGCTLEHAGYYLTWLIAIFGPVKRVVAASAELIENKDGSGPSAPDFSVAILFFENGMVARLTCSIVAPHNHALRVIGSKGVLEMNESWNNDAKVRFRRRFTVRRRLVNSPLARRIRLNAPTHPKVGRRGAASMNFALGPAEMLSALQEGRPCRMSADFALHLNEVTLAIQNARDSGGVTVMQTRCSPIEPMTWSNSKNGQ